MLIPEPKVEQDCVKIINLTCMTRSDQIVKFPILLHNYDSKAIIRDPMPDTDRKSTSL